VNRRLVLVSVLVLSPALLAACGNDNDSNATRADVLSNLSTDVFTPVYVELDRSTQALASATETLCGDPEEAQLRATRTAWTRAWTAWNRTRAFRFGPIIETRANADIAFMVDPDKIDTLLAEGRDTDTGEAFTAASLSEKGADVQGLAAVEHLLFERDPLEPATCAYADAASELAAAAARKIGVAWTDGAGDDKPFRDQLANPGDGMYTNAQGAVGDLVNGMSMALTEATRELANAETAPPGERETVGSHGGSRLRDMVWSVRAAYFGAASGTEGDGIADLVAAVSATADERVRDLLERADKAVAALPTSLDEASPGALANAYRLVRLTGAIVRTEVASELAVTLSLGDADGDS